MVINLFFGNICLKIVHLLSLILILFFSFNAHAVSETSEVLLRDHWPEYENGTHVMSLPQVSKILSKFEEHDKVSLEIRYPGGDFGKQWGESLMKWFVSFGIPRRFIELLPGSGAADQIVIAIIDYR